MEKKVFNKEEAEAEWNNWKTRINELRSNIQHAKNDIKIGILGDLEKMENHEAEIKNNLVKLNEGSKKWEDIEASIGDALFQINTTWNKINSRIL